MILRQNVLRTALNRPTEATESFGNRDAGRKTVGAAVRDAIRDWFVVHGVRQRCANSAYIIRLDCTPARSVFSRRERPRDLLLARNAKPTVALRGFVRVFLPFMLQGS
jgi:hypothetical protein